MQYETEQEAFWTGDFGNEYTIRNNTDQLILSKQIAFSKILAHTNSINSVLEIGANRGLNLRALKNIIPQLKMEAIEINSSAAAECAKITDTKVINDSIYNYPIRDNSFDMAFSFGVLIHIAPEKLKNVYELLYRSSRRYILVAEYYNPTPVEINYRGNKGKLFKRDFAGEMLDQYSDLSLIDYGFIYHRDNYFPYDDNNWFLMEKR